MGYSFENRLHKDIEMPSKHVKFFPVRKMLPTHQKGENPED